MSYITALGHYDRAINSAVEKLQHNRAHYMQDLTTIYLNSLRTGVPESYLNMMEDLISRRDTYDARKVVFDAADLTGNQARIGRRLSGGDYNYCAQRSNKLHANMMKKLCHDQSVHQQELEAVYSATPPNTPIFNFMDKLVKFRKERNDKDLLSNAYAWQALDQKVSSCLNQAGMQGGGAHVLNYGIAEALAGGETPFVAKSPSYEFNNMSAAELWQKLQHRARVS